MHFRFFFAVFWKIPLQNQKKGHQKKGAFCHQHKNKKQKMYIYLEQKKAYSGKICPSSHTLRNHLAHHNRTRFCRNLPKKMIKLPFFIANSYIFKYFSKSPYVIRIWFANNASKIPLQIFFLIFLQNHHI